MILVGFEPKTLWLCTSTTLPTDQLGQSIIIYVRINQGRIQSKSEGGAFNNGGAEKFSEICGESTNKNSCVAVYNHCRP